MRRVTNPDGKIIILEDSYNTKIGYMGLCLNDVAHNFFKPSPSFTFKFRDYNTWLETFNKNNLKLQSSVHFKVHHNIMTQYQFCLSPNKNSEGGLK